MDIAILSMQVGLIVILVFLVRDVAELRYKLSLLNRDIADLRSKLSELSNNWEKTESAFYSDEPETEMHDNYGFEQYMERRNAAFNERISAMKEELYAGTVAEELHPDVKNLPHDSVHTGESSAPDVEYTD